MLVLDLRLPRDFDVGISGSLSSLGAPLTTSPGDDTDLSTLASPGDGVDMCFLQPRPDVCAMSSAALAIISSPSLSLRRPLGSAPLAEHSLARAAGIDAKEPHCERDGDGGGTGDEASRSHSTAGGAAASPTMPPASLRTSSCCRNPSNDRSGAGRLSVTAVPLRRR